MCREKVSHPLAFTAPMGPNYLLQVESAGNRIGSKVWLGPRERRAQ